ncbi:MAG: DUF502 domain-containing protein [Pseudomonadota bacterium]|nr:DUF502 domain-containing protein [Pseudomonadota bacterium]
MVRKHLVAGLLFWIPVMVTIVTIQFLLNLMVRLFKNLPLNVQPDQWIGFHIPGIELILLLIIVWVTGILVANFVGKRFVHLGETMVSKLPLISSIYSGVKQIMQIMVSPSGQAFRQVVLISFPQPGSWAVGLVTHVDTVNATMTVFVPTTPNPTSGYVVTVNAADAQKLDMSVDEALKYIISLGTISHDALRDKFQTVIGENNK